MKELISRIIACVVLALIAAAVASKFVLFVPFWEGFLYFVTLIAVVEIVTEILKKFLNKNKGK